MLALLLVAVSVGMSNFAAAVSLGVAGVDARTRLRVGLVFGTFESGMPVVGLLIGDHVAAQLGHASRWIGGALLIGVGLYAILSSLRARAAAAAPPPESTIASETQAHAAGAKGVNPSTAGADADADAADAARAETTGASATEAEAAGAEPADAGAAGAEAVPSRPGRAYAGGNLQLLISGLALSLDNLVVGFALGTYQIAILVGAIVIGAVSVALSLIGLEIGARLGNWAGRRGDQLGGLILVAVGAAVASGALA